MTMNGLNEEHAESQMTIGDLIERLDQLPPDTLVNLGNSYSYRDYYSDIAFEKRDGATAAELLQECRDSMERSFKGHDGCDFYMHAGVPVWVAERDSVGKKLLSIRDDGTLETKDKD